VCPLDEDDEEEEEDDEDDDEGHEGDDEDEEEEEDEEDDEEEDSRHMHSISSSIIVFGLTARVLKAVPGKLLHTISAFGLAAGGSRV
jgi:ABC-type Zn2+ transport system substrate-binding protein/surface adhesin